MKKSRLPRVSGHGAGIALCLVLLAITFRLLPHPSNFAPVAAVAIFGGALLPRRLAVAVPLIVIVLTDVIIGLHDLIPVTWGAYALIALASSSWLAQKLSFLRGVLFVLASSLFFFVVTNFAVWLTSGMYAHTWSGLAECFALGVPFFRNAFIGDLFYTAVLFGLYVWVTQTADKAVPARNQITG